MGIFDVYVKKPKRNHFNLSHSRKYTMQDFGVLYPILCKELMPGDVFKHSHEHYLQFVTLSGTILHRFKVQTYYFFVPNRIIWDEFDDFISMDPNKFANPPIHPYVFAEDLFNGISTTPPFPNIFLANTSLLDYLGYRTFDYQGGNVMWNGSTAPSWDANSTKLNALPLRAYQKIWYDYFRDEESNASIAEKCSTSSGAAFEDQLFYLRSKAWSKDPFTTSLKFTTPHGYVPSVSGTITLEKLRDLKSSTLFFEKVMRSGDRPQEFIHGMFGVKPKDYRLDMPEFLNASSSVITMGNVYNSDSTQTTWNTTSALGFTVSTARSSSVAGGFKYRANEFGWLIGLATIVPDSVYAEGLPVELRDRPNNLDYPFPDFARLGDQGILNSEIREIPEYSGSPSGKQINDAIFAYAPRYWQYKFYLNELHGKYRGTLSAESFWTAARMIGNTPSRNSNFVYIANDDGTGRVTHVFDSSMDTDPSRLKRVFNIPNAPNLGPGDLKEAIAYCDLFHNISALRPLPYSSIPRL